MPRPKKPVIDCCDKCRYKRELMNYDYTGRGIVRTTCEGFACIAYVNDKNNPIIIQMVGVDPSKNYCDRFRDVDLSRYRRKRKYTKRKKKETETEDSKEKSNK